MWTFFILRPVPVPPRPVVNLHECPFPELNLCSLLRYTRQFPRSLCHDDENACNKENDIQMKGNQNSTLARLPIKQK